MGICPRTPTRAYTHIRTHTRPEGLPDLLRLSAGGEGVKVAALLPSVAMGARPGRSSETAGEGARPDRVPAAGGGDPSEGVKLGRWWSRCSLPWLRAQEGRKTSQNGQKSSKNKFFFAFS